jgi:hypothetical protein
MAVNWVNNSGVKATGAFIVCKPSKKYTSGGWSIDHLFVKNLHSNVALDWA